MHRRRLWWSVRTGELWVRSYLRAVCRSVAPKKEVFSLRAFFKNCPVWSASTRPRQLCRETEGRGWCKNGISSFIAPSCKFLHKHAVTILNCWNLRPVLQCTGGLLRGLSASADELWEDTSEPGPSPLQHTHTQPGGSVDKATITLITLWQLDRGVDIEMGNCTHILLNSVGMVKAKHPFTDDHCFQLYTASLNKNKKKANWLGIIIIQCNKAFWNCDWLSATTTSNFGRVSV